MDPSRKQPSGAGRARTAWRPWGQPVPTRISIAVGTTKQCIGKQPQIFFALVTSPQGPIGMPPCSCPPPVIPAGSGRVVLRKEPASIMAGSRRLGRRGGRWEAGILQPRADLAAWRAGNSGLRYEDGRPRSKPCARIASRSVHGDARAASRRSCRRRRNRPLCARAQSLGTSWPDAASRRPGVRGRLLRLAQMRRAAPPPADQRDMHAFGPGRGAHCPAPRPRPLRALLSRPGRPAVGPRRHAPRPSPGTRPSPTPPLSPPPQPAPARPKAK